MPAPGFLLGGRPPVNRLLQGPQAQQQGFIGGNTQSPFPVQGGVSGMNTLAADLANSSMNVANQGQPINSPVNMQTGLQGQSPLAQQQPVNTVQPEWMQNLDLGGESPYSQTAPNGLPWGYGGAALPSTQQQPVNQFGGGDGLIGGNTQQPYWTTLPDGPEQDAARASNAPYPTAQQPPNPTAQPQGQQGQYGLAGAEQAFSGALNAGLGALQQGQGSALNTLIGGGALAQGQFDQGINALNNRFNQAGQLNQQAQQQLLQAQQQAFNQSGQAQRQGLGAIQSGISAGQGMLSPFAATGGQANQVQAALSGALGNEAQAQAFADFQASPEQAFLREQGEIGIINQASALGGLGGGNVRKELSRFGTGLAAQDFQNRFNRLGGVANRGATAAGQSAQLAGQGALAQGNLIGSLGGQRAGLAGQLGQAGANLTGQLAGQGLQVGGQELGARQNLGNLFGNMASQGAGFQQQGGRDASSLFANTGSQIGNARTNAGNQIAGNIQDTTRGLADFASQQGEGLSNIVQRGGEGLSNYLAESGMFSASQIQQLLPMLTNLTTSQSAQVGKLLQDASNAGTNSDLAATQGQQQLGADVIGTIAGMFSDERLKENIKPVGDLDGINFYTWQWNDKMPDKELIGKSGFGVLAQELEVNHPELVINDDPSGYKKVDYAGLEKLCH